MQKCKQTHHDIFVRLKHEKNALGEQLTYEEQIEYNTAAAREEVGLVQPLAERE